MTFQNLIAKFPTGCKIQVKNRKITGEVVGYLLPFEEKRQLIISLGNHWINLPLKMVKRIK